MKGSIRVIVGLLVVLGGAGATELSSNTEEYVRSLAVALVGLASMAWGTWAMNREQADA